MSDNEKKSNSTSKKDKSNMAEKSSFKHWLHELKVELKKVQWPSKKATANHTTTVLCCVALVGVFIWVFDFLASNVIQALIQLV